MDMELADRFFSDVSTLGSGRGSRWDYFTGRVGSGTEG